MVYQFAKNTQITGDPQEIGDCLAAIHAARGHLLASDVVEEARPEGHVLHPHFEWDDAVAAEEYRKQQARRLIQCVVIVEGPAHETTPPVRAFANVVDDGLRTYHPIRVIMETPSLREQLLEEVRADIDRLRIKLARLEDFADIVGMVDELERAFKGRAQTPPSEKVAA